MENLPLDLSFNILSRLPVVSLIYCKHVSKAWHALVITHPSLPYLHHAYHESQHNPCLILHSSNDQLYLVDNCSDLNTNQPCKGLVKTIDTPLNDHKFKFVLHCNGLLFLSYTEVDDLCTYSKYSVYNLFTSELINLPSTSMTSEYNMAYGFGFHPRTREYKVAKIVEHECVRYNSSLGTCELTLDQSFEVFTLGSSEWRIKKNNMFPFIRMESCEALVDGALHWLGKAKLNASEVIVAFNLINEEFSQIPSPHCTLEGLNSRLLVLGGCLSLAVYAEKNKIDVWMMKEYGMKESWTKEFIINPEFPLRGFIRPLSLLKNGEILFEYEKQALFSYESDTKRIKKIEVSNLPHSFEAVPHIKSINSTWYL